MNDYDSKNSKQNSKQDSKKLVIPKEELIKNAKGKSQGVTHRCGPHKHKNDRRNSVKSKVSKKSIKEQLDE